MPLYLRRWFLDDLLLGLSCFGSEAFFLKVSIKLSAFYDDHIDDHAPDI